MLCLDSVNIIVKLKSKHKIQFHPQPPPKLKLLNMRTSGNEKDVARAPERYKSLVLYYSASLWWRRSDIVPVLFSSPPLSPASGSWRLVRMMRRGSCLSGDLTSSWRTGTCAPWGQTRIKSLIRRLWEPWSDPPRWKYWGQLCTTGESWDLWGQLNTTVETWGPWALSLHGLFIPTAFWGHFAPSLWSNK